MGRRVSEVVSCSGYWLSPFLSELRHLTHLNEEHQLPIQEVHEGASPPALVGLALFVDDESDDGQEEDEDGQGGEEQGAEGGDGAGPSQEGAANGDTAPVEGTAVQLPALPSQSATQTSAATADGS